MTAPSFWEGAGLALGASLAGSILSTALLTLTAGSLAWRLVITLLGFFYVLYLLGRAPVRTGRIVTVAAWGVMALGGWFLALPFTPYLLLHIGLIWLIRSLYFHVGLLAALADLGLNGLALAAAVWAEVHTHSPFLMLWCFFLVQALFSGIPARPSRAQEATGNDRFEAAHRLAEAAVQQLLFRH